MNCRSHHHRYDIKRDAEKRKRERKNKCSNEIETPVLTERDRFYRNRMNTFRLRTKWVSPKHFLVAVANCNNCKGLIEAVSRVPYRWKTTVSITELELQMMTFPSIDSDKKTRLSFYFLLFPYLIGSMNVAQFMELTNEKSRFERSSFKLLPNFSTDGFYSFSFFNWTESNWFVLFEPGTRSNRGLRLTPSAEMKGRDGHSFAYILHYLSTGDLIYPLHEGFHRVDVLLKVSTATSQISIFTFADPTSEPELTIENHSTSTKQSDLLYEKKRFSNVYQDNFVAFRSFIFKSVCKCEKPVIVPIDRFFEVK